MANTDWLGVTNTILNTVVPFAQGSAQKAAGQFEAQQHYFNAQRRLRAGEQEAMGHRARGRRIASDAKTAMVAQGGTVDSAMLARIKREAEMDAIAAMFDAKADADTSRFAGQAAAQQGENYYRAGIIKAGTNLVDGASTLYKNRQKKVNPLEYAP